LHADAAATLPAVRPSALAPILAAALAIALAGCGKSGSAQSILVAPNAVAPPSSQGVLAVATKNTTRLGGADSATNAAAVARAVYPGMTATGRPQAVVLVDEHNWAAALTTSALAGAPLKAAILYTDGNALPSASAQALEAMHPFGAHALDDSQVLEIGVTVPLPSGYRARSVALTAEPAATAVALERVLRLARGAAPRQVIVVPAEAPQSLQMPAAGLAAESGAPVLFATAAGVPLPTASLLAHLNRPAIYVIDSAGLGARTLATLSRLGPVTQITHDTAAPGSPTGQNEELAAQNAIAVARFSDGTFGWGVKEPGHGLVFANSAQPADGPAGALLSSTGDYGPLLLLESPATLPRSLAQYLSDIQPAYGSAPQFQPVHGAYNHGWVIGDERSISALAQAQIDSLLEIAPRSDLTEGSGASEAQGEASVE
jgi:hypothetical protein